MEEFEKIIDFIKSKKLGSVYLNKSFSEMTSLKVGGKIRLVFAPETIDKFLVFYDFYYKNHQNIPLVVLGNGTNILASDREFLGIVLVFKELKVQYYQINDYFYFYPQCKMSFVVKTLMKMGCADIEYFGGIPGTIGGLVTMNASYLDKMIGDYVLDAVVLTKDNKIKIYKNKELCFNYRTSIIKENKDIILLIKMKFKKTSVNKLLINYQKLMHFRKMNQPLNQLSAGCTFKNPKERSAWEIIKDLGFSNYQKGGAKVSEKHTNFIINTGNAKSCDLYELMIEIQTKAKEKFNIELESEWILINF